MGTPKRGAQTHQETTAIAVSTQTRLNESGRAVHTLEQGEMSLLERRRLELELGPGGDLDVPYSFATATSPFTRPIGTGSTKQALFPGAGSALGNCPCLYVTGAPTVLYRKEGQS